MFTVMVDGELFNVPGGALRHAILRYVPASGDVDYTGLKAALREERLPANPATLATCLRAFRDGYADFDVMEQQGLREPIAVGGYEFVMRPSLQRIGLERSRRAAQK